MSIPNETQNTMEDVYGDFQEALDKEDVAKAKEIHQRMKEYSEEESERMWQEILDLEKTIRTTDQI